MTDFQPLQYRGFVLNRIEPSNSKRSQLFLFALDDFWCQGYVRPTEYSIATFGSQNEAGTPGSQFSPCAPVLELKARIARQMQKSYIKLCGIVSIPVAESCKLIVLTDRLVPKETLAAAISAHSFSTWRLIRQERYQGVESKTIGLSVCFNVQPSDQCKSGGKTLLMSFADCYR